jgi:hypothetical protein
MSDPCDGARCLGVSLGRNRMSENNNKQQLDNLRASSTGRVGTRTAGGRLASKNLDMSECTVCGALLATHPHLATVMKRTGDSVRKLWKRPSYAQPVSENARSHHASQLASTLTIEGGMPGKRRTPSKGFMSVQPPTDQTQARPGPTRAPPVNQCDVRGRNASS